MKKICVGIVVILTASLVLDIIIVIFSFGLSAVFNVIPKKWGSFTDRPVISSDGKYRAEHDAVKLDGYNVKMIQVDVYDNAADELLCSFVPARAMDFYGICFEEGTHNIWTQSADIGIHCYERIGDEWVRDEDAVCPKSIQSKWDKYK